MKLNRSIILSIRCRHVSRPILFICCRRECCCTETQSHFSCWPSVSVQPESRPNSETHVLDVRCWRSVSDAVSVWSEPGSGSEVPQFPYRERSRHVSVRFIHVQPPKALRWTYVSQNIICSVLAQVLLYGVSLSSGGFNAQLSDGAGHVRLLW